MKVTRARRAVREILGVKETLRNEMPNALGFLDAPADPKQWRGPREGPMRFEDADPEHQVHEAGLVLEGEEGDAAGGLRALPADDLAHVGHLASVAAGKPVAVIPSPGKRFSGAVLSISLGAAMKHVDIAKDDRMRLLIKQRKGGGLNERTVK